MIFEIEYFIQKIESNTKTNFKSSVESDSLMKSTKYMLLEIYNNLEAYSNKPFSC